MPSKDSLLLPSTEIEQLLSSVVLAGEVAKLRRLSIVDLEERLGSSIQGTESIVAAEVSGSGTLVQLTKHHIEVVLTPRKWEFNAKGENLTRPVADQLARAVTVFNELVESAAWTVIGYNYNVVFEAPGGKSAGEAIAASTIRISELSERLGVQLQGAASWLYFDEPDGVKVWLKIEPRGGRRDTKRVWAYGNFEQPVTNSSTQLSEASVREQLLALHTRFFTILKNL